MRQLTRNVFVETEIRGCNHGLVTTSDGIVMIDSPHKPSDALKLKEEIARRGGRLRYIINTEPHGDHWTGNAFFDVPVVAHEGVRGASSKRTWRSMSRGWRASGRKNRGSSKAIGRTRP